MLLPAETVRKPAPLLDICAAPLGSSFAVARKGRLHSFADHDVAFGTGRVCSVHCFFFFPERHSLRSGTWEIGPAEQ